MHLEEQPAARVDKDAEIDLLVAVQLDGVGVVAETVADDVAPR
jgi:hypothetical protein